MAKPCHIAMIGQKFMGRAHSNAWRQAPCFFADLPRTPTLHTVIGRDQQELADFAAQWGWPNHTTNWRNIIADETVDLVDLCTPNDFHAEPALAAIEAGKHVTCEKPLAHTLDAARQMRDAARKSKAKSFVWYNYRRCPAVAFAHEFVQRKRLGRIYHIRAHYLQSWGGPDTPLFWRFQKKHAGSGAHGDLNAHIIDMARFITGDKIIEVNGAISQTFIKERTRINPKRGEKKTGRSDVDDCVLFLATFKSGAVASFEASRLATGHLNENFIEINGEHGALRFNFERMNELEFFDATEAKATAGWRSIMCTSAGDHPYAERYWPDAHIIGYEHSFVNMAADIMRAIAGRKPRVPLPDFADAWETQRVLEAALLAAKNRCAVSLSEVK